MLLRHLRGGHAAGGALRRLPPRPPAGRARPRRRGAGVDVVTFIEWGDAVATLLPGDRLEVELRHDGGRRPGTAAADRPRRLRRPDPRLASACAAWTDGRALMLVLGLETSTARSSVALVEDDRVVASASLGVPRRHGEFVAPAIRFCLGPGRRRPRPRARRRGRARPGPLHRAAGRHRHRPDPGRRPVAAGRGLSGLDVLAFRARYVRRLLRRDRRPPRRAVLGLLPPRARAGCSGSASCSSAPPTGWPPRSRSSARSAWSSATAAWPPPRARGVGRRGGRAGRGLARRRRARRARRAPLRARGDPAAHRAAADLPQTGRRAHRLGERGRLHGGEAV
jgi:hypothetical protein